MNPAAPITFSTLVNNNPAPITESVSLNNQPVTNLIVSASTTAGQPGGWLPPPTVNGSTFTVNINAIGLQPGTYTGVISISASGVTTPVPVMLTVFGSNTLTASPTSLSFSGQANGPAPAAQTIALSSTTTGVTFTTAVTTASGGNWLSVASSGTATPSTLTVTANPGTLAAGTYTGAITVTSSNIQPLTIQVTFMVSNQAVIVATPPNVSLLYQSGVNAPAPTQSVQIAATSGSFSYTGTIVYPSTNTCGTNWLQVTNGLSGVTPATLTVVANLAGLPATANCGATINLTAPASGNVTLVIPVSLSISPNTQIGVSPGFLTFMYSLGSTIPAVQNLTVFTSNNTALNYSVTSTTSFLSLPVTPVNGFTSSTVAVGLNQAAIQALNPGTYNGSVIISALGSSIAPVTVPVVLVVSSNPLFVVTPPLLNFNYQTGTNPPGALGFNIATTTGSLPFTLAAPSTTGTQLVLLSPATGTATTSPQTINVSLNPTALSALAPGFYTVNVLVSGSGSSANVTFTLPVNITVSTTPLVNIVPQNIVFPAYTTGAGITPINVTLTSTDGVTPLPVSQPVSNSSWLLVTGLNSAVTPATFSVSFNPAGLSPGTYNGIVTINSPGQIQALNVSLTIVSAVAISTTPGSLTFTQPMGGAPPANQTLTVNTTGGTPLSFSANAATASGGNWLTVNGSGGTVTGTAPMGLTISTNGTVNGTPLAVGTYNGTITIASNGASNPSLVVPVTLTITSPQSLAVNPATLTFSGAVASSAPASQTIAVTSTTGSPVAFTAAAQSQGGTWLTVTPTSATTTANITVAANQAGLMAGSYMGTVTLTPTAAGSTPLVINVMLTVGTQATPAVVAVTNAASGATGAIAPGEIVQIFGTGLGPVTPVGTALTASGSVSTNIGNTQVFFDGIAAPLTYVAGGQINAVVPYEVAGKTTTQVTVNFNGVTSAATAVPVTATAPGIFTQNGTGSGLGAVLNQNATVNATGNPAARGSVIVIYATGEGQTNAPGVTGSVIGSGVKFPVAPVSVTIGGQAATILYAGSAPGDVSGVFQLNVTVPSGVTPGASVPVVVQVGSVSSQANVTVAVQ